MNKALQSGIVIVVDGVATTTKSLLNAKRMVPCAYSSTE